MAIVKFALIICAVVCARVCGREGVGGEGDIKIQIKLDQVNAKLLKIQDEKQNETKPKNTRLFQSE